MTNFIQSTTGVLHIVLKITERCNLACPYCYFFFADDTTFKKHPPTIPLEKVDQLIAFVERAVRENSVQTVRIGLHGGEPLLLKKAVFRAICEKLHRKLDNICNFNIVMQTNAVLIDEEWIEIFCEHAVQVGVSFDGAEKEHNLTRVDKKGRGTYAKTENNWRLLVDAANNGRLPYPSLLCVVNPSVSGSDLLRHFVNVLGAQRLNFLLPDLSHDASEISQTFVDGCAKFILDVYEEWIALNDKRVTIRYINESLLPLMSDEVGRDLAIGRYEPNSLVCVSSSGELCPDDVMRGIAPLYRDTGLNLDSHSYSDILESKPWGELQHAYRNYPKTCDSCQWLNLCHGGFPQHRYSNVNGLDNPSVYCSALKKLYVRIEETLLQLGHDKSVLRQRAAAKHRVSFITSSELG